MNTAESSLAFARTQFGPLSEESKDKIRRVIANPCPANWDDAYGVLVSTRTTLWAAVCHVDPTFPKYGCTRDGDGRITKEWERIPSRFLIESALFWATH